MVAEPCSREVTWMVKIQCDLVEAWFIGVWQTNYTNYIKYMGTQIFKKATDQVFCITKERAMQLKSYKKLIFVQKNRKTKTKEKNSELPFLFLKKFAFKF